MDDSRQPGSKGDSLENASDSSGQPTIVGGRPGGKGRGTAEIPVGIQVLVKKAAVDSEFRDLLLEERSQAASRIGLELTPAEIATVNSVPKAQLEKIIAHTKVPDEHRRVFLGYLGAAMAASLLSPISALPREPDMERSLGVRPDRPPSEGIRILIRGISPDGQGGRANPAVPVRVKRWQERLSFTVLDEKPGSVRLAVRVDCPFQQVSSECSSDAIEKKMPR